MGKPRSLKVTLAFWPSIIFSLFILGLVVASTSIYSLRVKSTNYAQVQATSEQILANYETYFSSSVGISDAILSRYATTDPEEADSLTPFFDDIREITPEILSISLYRASDGHSIAKDSLSSYDVGFLSEGWYVEALDDRYINVFNAPSTEPGIPYSYTLSRYLPNDINPSYSAVLKIDFDFGEIVQGMSPVDLGEGGRLLIYGPDYGLIYSSLPDSNKDALGILKALVIGETTAELWGHSYYVYSMTVASTGWRIAIFTNIDATSGAILQFTLMVVGMGALCVLLFVGIMAIVANRLSNPLRLLQREMSRVASLDYQANLALNSAGSTEVRDLYGSFGEMMTRIKLLTGDLLKEKEEQRKSELRALQNQINPHFLYNTLDSIIALIDQGQGEQAERMIVALSRFFRLSISRGHNIIPLKDELEHARNYLLIQKMRFLSSFDFGIEVKVDMSSLYVVKLILQPIIENALVHGLKEDETTHILVRAYEEGDFLKLSVSDDGYGMREAKRRELLSNMKSSKTYKGVGLKNVYSRLRIYYGEQADISIDSQEDVGTTVVISIPIEKARHNDEGE